MTCALCDPGLGPNGPRKNEGHLAVRFNDFLASVFKNGERTHDVYEVEAPDRAWRYVLPYQLCECGQSAKAYLDETGGFAVTVNNNGNTFRSTVIDCDHSSQVQA